MRIILTVLSAMVMVSFSHVGCAKALEDQDFSTLLKQAEHGNVRAQFLIGNKYELGIPYDYAKAVAWYQKAAKQGDPEAQRSLALMYAEGRGVAQNDVQAVSWYRKSAAQEEVVAQYSLGYMYEYGRGVTQDYATAAEWYQKVAERGLAMAQYSLGALYENGHGVPQDDNEALKWYQKAAVQDHDNDWALVKVGEFYRDGRVVPRDYAKAFALFQKAESYGNAAAAYDIGLAYENKQGVKRDEDIALSWYKKAAGKDYAPAETKLGTIYWGWQDLDTAIAYLESAVAQGDDVAAYTLGLIYLEEHSIRRDVHIAANWLRKAASMGNIDAQKKLKKL
ncbi:hypothetical protein BG621_06490 [Parasaccharibacter apium]|nr:hypothetical protein BG621_06490 [Parasaccharibacter apium]